MFHKYTAGILPMMAASIPTATAAAAAAAATSKGVCRHVDVGDGDGSDSCRFADQSPVLWHGSRLAQAAPHSRFWWRSTLQAATVLKESGSSGGGGGGSGAGKGGKAVSHDSSYRSTLCTHFMESGVCPRARGQCDFGTTSV